MSKSGCSTLPSEGSDASLENRRMRGSIAAKLFGGQGRQTQVGRFTLLKVLGEGGMGLVYRAYDPTLDRAVALKLLRRGRSPQLVREAKAMARLSHPHVVAVHEVGDHDGVPFVAMELVSGGTLAQYSRARPAGTKGRIDEMTELMLRCARGLVAAHAVGIVHRDIKPHNVLITHDGMPKVADFGLAHAPDLGLGGPRSELLETARGGTPAYMSPEQFLGQADERSDQFSFCVAFFEALHGRRPYAGRGIEALARMVTHGERADVALAPDVPAWLNAILDRGLKPDPDDRFPSMDALVEAIERGRAGSRSRVVVGSIILVAAAGGVVGGYALAAAPNPVCEGSETQLASIWSPTRAASIQENLSEAPFVAEAWKRLAGELDQYSARWIESHRAVCVAAQVRREITSEMMDLQMACLADRKRHLSGLVDVVAKGDKATLAHPDLAEASLPEIDRCNDLDYVRHQGYEAPTEASERVAARVAEATARHAAGDRLGARASAEQALAQATASADEAGIARAHLVLGRSVLGLAEARSARDHFIAAYDKARRTGMPDVATEAAVMLVRVTGLDLDRSEEAMWWVRIAEIEGARIDAPMLMGRLGVAAAHMLQRRGEPDEAIRRAKAGLERMRDAGGATDWRYLQAQRELGVLLYNGGDPAGGRVLVEAAARATREILGAEHPENANTEDLLAYADATDGKLAAAVAHARRAVALAEAALGPRHIRLGSYLGRLAYTLALLGETEQATAAVRRGLALDQPTPLPERKRARLYFRLGEAEIASDPQAAAASFRRAFEHARASLGGRHRSTLQYRAALADTLVRQGRYDEGTKELETTLTIVQSVHGESHPDVGYMHHSLASAYEARGDDQLALAHYERSLELLVAAYGPDSFTVGMALVNLCGSFLRLGRPERALEPCRRAVVLTERGVGAHEVQANARTNLGAALSETGELAAARRELEQAHVSYRRALGEGSYEESVVLFNLGEVAEREGDCKAAVVHYGQALRIRTRVRGAEHPSTKNPRAGLARCRRARRVATPE